MSKNREQKVWDLRKYRTGKGREGMERREEK